jgi:hypothetical protein
MWSHRLSLGLCSTALSGCAAATSVMIWPELFHSFGLPATGGFLQDFIQALTGETCNLLQSNRFASNRGLKFPLKGTQIPVSADLNSRWCLRRFIDNKPPSADLNSCGSRYVLTEFSRATTAGFRLAE